ncbi:OLC1v1036752C1 [Oldenlandia corymbosa var. corymbosa]|uniref:OLC1v1036752C1 n=1 Tax=Oldenlandia corymbosa var. corymbosa TaxID=529605 RepID=A0AAV1CY61_OLDCO|nr:OLC1v1036752C1 [Oldenlandia corymbosa var. corymbosa]
MAKEVVRVEDVECLLTQERLGELESYYSLTAVNPILPKGHERANTPPPGKITIYKKFLEYGLHFPLMPMFRKIVEAYGRPLAQYTPNLITIVLAFVHVCNKMGVEPDIFLFRCFYKLVRCGKSFPEWFSFTKNPHGPSKELVAKNESSKHWRLGFFYVDANFVSLFPWTSDEGGTVSLDPWTKKDKKDIETRRRDLEKLAGWKKTYTYRQIASLSNRISSRNQDVEEQYAEEGPQEVAPPETGAASSVQTTRTPVEGSKRGSSSGQSSGHLKRKRGASEVVEVDPLSFSLPAIHELSSLDDLLKEGYADPGRGTDLFEDIPAGHALLTFDPPRVECSELPETGATRLEDDMRQVSAFVFTSKGSIPVNVFPHQPRMFPLQAVQAVSTFVTVCAGLREQLVSAQRAATSEANRARDTEVMFKASEGRRAHLEEERKRLEEEIARVKAQLKDAELTHRLEMESLLATSVPKSGLDTYILAGVQWYLGSTEFALGINDVMDPAMERGARKVVLEIEAAQKKNDDIQPILEKYADRDRKGKMSAVRLRCKARKHFRDMDFARLPIMQQISEASASLSKPEDILNIPGSPSFVFQMPRGTETPPSTPPGPEEEPEIIASDPPPQGHNSGSQGGGGTSTDSNARSGDKVNDA